MRYKTIYSRIENLLLFLKSIKNHPNPTKNEKENLHAIMKVNKFSPKLVHYDDITKPLIAFIYFYYH